MKLLWFTGEDMYECNIAEKLVELRTLKGITQDDAAQILSVSNKTISKWETGASMPDLSMVVELAKYYGVTTDTLLGLSEDKKQSTTEEVKSLFDGLDRRESVLKAFDVIRSIVPAMYDTVYKHKDDACDKENAFPTGAEQRYRSEISLPEFFDFSASSENANVSVMMLKNKADFAWMNDANKQKEIIKIFKLLSDENVLSVIYFIHSTNCSENFTAEYIASHTGVKQECTAEILDEFCSVGECYCSTAHLTEGEIKIYKCYGDGMILSLITLAFEKMCGRKYYDYNFNGGCKMIGGK